MRCYVILVALASFLVVANAMSWEEYKLKYNKVYKNPAEEVMRHAIFMKNVARIESHQNSLASYKIGLNHLSDLTSEEFKKMNQLKVGEPLAMSPEMDQFIEDLINDNSTAPESVDYRPMANRVSPIKDQGSCGSCWSFATTGLLEGQEYLRVERDEVVPLSEQELLDCDHTDQACNGGFMTSALEYIKKAGGLESEDDYPYISGEGQDHFKCKFSRQLAEKSTRNIKTFGQLKAGDEEILKRVVAKYGPVAIAMDASGVNFQSYESGVYYDETCKNDAESMDHGVLVVGYGTCEKQGDYWIVKNSWGTTWGEEGYFKIARNKDNHCGVANAPVVVKV